MSRIPYLPYRGCNCCTVSRRCFMASSIAAFTAAPFVAVGADEEASKRDPGEHIDLKSLRPRPTVRIKAAVVRVKPPYWLGWPGTSYDLEGHRKEYEAAFQEMARKTEVTLQMAPKPIEEPEKVTPWIEQAKAEKADAMLVHLQHIHCWRWLDPIKKAGIPTIIWAPIGTAFTGHVRGISRMPGIHVISSLETSAIEQAFRIIRAKRQFEETRLLVVRGKERKEAVLERLGTKVRYIPRRTLSDLFHRTPVTDEVREVAKKAAAGAEKVVEPSGEDLLNAARAFVAAKHLCRDEKSNAITTDCLGMVSSRVVPTPPCLAASLFQDGGGTYGCEADVFGAMSLMLTSYLFDKPGFMNDPVPETVNNLLLAAHCVCGTKIDGFDGPQERHILRSHSESNLGVSLQVLWRVGRPVTLVRFQNPNQLILDTGVVVGNQDTPPAGGCRTDVKIKMDRVEDSRDVLGFHQVVFAGNHRRDVENFCQMWGIEVVNSPERPPTEGTA
ncbi:MAG TPA: hypothetical protein EYP56_10975 [Planctomycetaceae bacterium]|nr:hypothetical protein [Planctomycetaceae bacterium]